MMSEMSSSDFHDAFTKSKSDAAGIIIGYIVREDVDDIDGEGEVDDGDGEVDDGVGDVAI